MNAGDVVAAYVRGRREAGVDTPEHYKKILGAEAKVLLGKGWEPEVVISAAVNFGSLRRHPKFLPEWVAITLPIWEHATYLIRKAEESRPMSPEVAQFIKFTLKKMPKLRDE